MKIKFVISFLACFCLGITIAFSQAPGQNTPAKATKSKSNSRKQQNAKEVIDGIRQPVPEPAYDPNVDRDKLMLLDAILELNEALLAGVNASLDTLQQPLPRYVNPKDKRAVMLLEKRKKEQEELLPYFQHIHDSLTENTRAILLERATINARLNPEQAARETALAKEAEPVQTNEVKTGPIAVEKPETILKSVEKAPAFERAISAQPERTKPKPEEMVVVKSAPVAANKEIRPVRWESARAIIDTAALAKYESEEFQQPVEKPVRRRTEDDTITHIKSDFFFRRAQKYLAYKQNKRAYDYLNKSLELWNNNYAALIALADLDAQNGDYAKSIKGYEQAMKLEPTVASLPFKMGKAYLLWKKKNDAIRSLTLAIRMDSTYTEAYMERAAIFAGSNKYQDAIADYTSVLNMNKSDLHAYRQRGITRLMSKKFASATEDFTRFLVFDQSDASVYYYRGLAKIGNSDLLEGCLDLSTASDMGYAAALKMIRKNCE